LTEDGSFTVLRYSVQASVGGKLAQIGQRLIDGTAKKLSEEFFGNFSAILGGSAAAESVAEPQLSSSGGLNPALWITALILVMAALTLMFVL